MSMVRWAGTAGIFALVALPAASADDLHCQGPIAGGQYGNVVVGHASNCSLLGTRVLGSIEVAYGGALEATGVEVDGGVTAFGAESIEILESYVKGDVSIRGTNNVPAGQPANRICDSWVDGVVQLTQNRAPFDVGCAGGGTTAGNHIGDGLHVEDNAVDEAFARPDVLRLSDNQIGGSLRFLDNVADRGGFVIEGNDVLGDLRCADNSRKPVVEGNAVAGASSCAGGAWDGQGQSGAGGPGGDPTLCDGILAGDQGHLYVPNKARCQLDGTFVDGSIRIELGGALESIGAVITGDIEASGAAWITILDTHVQGHVSIVKTYDVAALGTANTICGSQIDGFLELLRNRAPFDVGCGTAGTEQGNTIEGGLDVGHNSIRVDFGTDDALLLANNTVGGDVQFRGNSSTVESGIANNEISGDLLCRGNLPGPKTEDNHVEGLDRCTQRKVIDARQRPGPRSRDLAGPVRGAGR